MDQDPGSGVPFDEYARAVPTDEETARRAVEPCRDMTPQQRWEAFAALLREMEGLLDGREPWRGDDDGPFWRYWVDPLHGRPR